MKKIYLLIIVCLSAFCLQIENSEAKDMSPWAKSSFERLEKRKIIPFILKKDKDLTENITRLEFTHLIMTYLMSNKSYISASYPRKYKDINDNFVNLSAHLKITTGYTDGTFKPNTYITRSEAVVIANNVETFLGTSKDGSIMHFKDYKFIQQWAVRSVGAMAKVNAISGYPDKTFGPSKNITREEAIVMVDKLVLQKSNKLIEAFDISKDDEYLTKLQYNFVLANIPTSKYSADDVKHQIFQTSFDKRMQVYNAFIKTRPISSNEIKTSPNLIFDVEESFCILGIEKRNQSSGKKEQRAFMIRARLKASDLEIVSQNEYGPWFTVEK